jgi:hypothetical protein
VRYLEARGQCRLPLLSHLLKKPHAGYVIALLALGVQVKGGLLRAPFQHRGRVRQDVQDIVLHFQATSLANHSEFVPSKLLSGIDESPNKTF